MGFKIANSGDCQKSQFRCTSNFGTRLGGSVASKRVSKPMVFKMASSVDFPNSQIWCASNLVPVWVFPIHASHEEFLRIYSRSSGDPFLANSPS